MEKYKILKTLGDGTYGTVFKAVNTKTNEVVAIKTLKRKFESWDECKQLREVKSLMKLNHPCIVKLIEVLKVKDELHLVFEFLEENLYQCYQKMKESKESRFSEKQIKSIVFQAAEALAYMHKHGFFHRDMKPENMLVHREAVKLADFGLAREIRSRPPFTDYVSTRWYRAPEILLKATNYNSPVDIFALGCIMAELYIGAPLFAGNSEFDQIYKICSVLGTPTQAAWPEGYRLASQLGFNLPQLTGIGLGQVMKDAPLEAINLVAEMLRFDPAKRPTAQQVLQHPYFSGYFPSKVLINDVEPLPTATLGSGLTIGDDTLMLDSSRQVSSKIEKTQNPINQDLAANLFGLSDKDADNLDLVLESLLKKDPKPIVSTDPVQNDPWDDTKKYEIQNPIVSTNNQTPLTQRTRKGQSAVQDYSALENDAGYDFKFSSVNGDNPKLSSQINGGEMNLIAGQRNVYGFSTKEQLNFPSDTFNTKTNNIYDFSNVLVKKEKFNSPIDGTLEDKPYHPSMSGVSTTNNVIQGGIGGYTPSFSSNYNKDDNVTMGNGENKVFLSCTTNRSALGGTKFGANKDLNAGNNAGGTFSSSYQSKPFGTALSTNLSARNITVRGSIDGGVYRVPHDLYKF